MLTAEDQSMLERWNSIYPRPSSHSVSSSDDSQSTWPGAESVSCHVSERRNTSDQGDVVSHGLHGRAVNGSLLSVHAAPSLWPDAVPTGCSAACNEGSLLPAPSLWSSGVFSSAVQTNCSAACQQVPMLPPAVAPRYLPPTEIQPSLTALLTAQTSHSVGGSPELLTSVNLSDCGRGQRTGGDFDKMLDARTPDLFAGTRPVFPTTGQAAVDTRFLPGSHFTKAAAASVPLAWRIYDRAGLSNIVAEPQRDAEVGRNDSGGGGDVVSLRTGVQSGPLFDTGSSLMCDNVHVTCNTAEPSGVSSESGASLSGSLLCGLGSSLMRTDVPNGSLDQPGSSGSDDLRVITSRLMRSHVEDLTLHHTPRGTGAGYGVGVDLDLDLPSSAGSRAATHDGSVSQPPRLHSCSLPENSSYFDKPETFSHALFEHNSLQCFDAVGWAAGRASGL